ncbi:MAG: NAD(P)-dependent oxidoreductase [Candidatus Marinimicrobia bacterium]|nr:NAD(P)-dependent oxidoreductase [Candidatus Neomarinimicrobiota bacterium]
MRILITGASGTIGSALLKQLGEQSERHDITVFDIETRQSRRLFSSYQNRIKIFFGDITRQDDVDAACSDQDVIIHLAAIIPPLADRYPDLARRVNVDGTRHVLSAMQRLSPGAFLCYASSIAVYGDRIKDPEIRVTDPLQVSQGDAYAESKIATEALIRNASVDWTIFRLTAIMGVKNHKVSGIMFHMPLNTPLEIATPEDAARAFLHAIENRALLTKKVFNLGGGPLCRIRYHEFIQRSFRLFGLGKLNFPALAFARKNFHCGYYLDGDELENILHFRRDTIESYFSRIKRSVPEIRKWFTYMFCIAIKRHLLRLSEPWKALRTKDSTLIRRFFGEETLPVLK